MNELIVGVIGCGGVGRLHLNAWALQSGVRIAAVCDADTLLAARTVMKLEGVAAYADTRSLLGAGQFDVVDVCTPIQDRYDAAAAALRSGANVVCETPMASTAAQAQALVTLAADRERLLMPAYLHRFHPPVLFVRELLDNNDLGRTVSFRCRFSDPRKFSPTGGTLGEPALFGVVRETGQHGLDLFRSLFGEVAAVRGMTSTITPGLAVEDNAVIAVRADDGTIGSVEVSLNLPGCRNVIEIYGTEGACILDYDTGTVRFKSAEYPIWQTHDVSGLNGLEACLAHFSDAVRGLQPLSVTGVDGARALELIEGLEDQAA